MDTATAPPLDLAGLEHRLEQRACWQEDPAAYRQGVRDAFDELRARMRDAEPLGNAIAG